MSPASCEILYIDTAKSLDGYGIDLFKATLVSFSDIFRVLLESNKLIFLQWNDQVLSMFGLSDMMLTQVL